MSHRHQEKGLLQNSKVIVRTTGPNKLRIVGCICQTTTKLRCSHIRSALGSSLIKEMQLISRCSALDHRETTLVDSTIWTATDTGTVMKGMTSVSKYLPKGKGLQVYNLRYRLCSLRRVAIRSSYTPFARNAQTRKH